jgi:uncharacterized protein (TIGR02246 family)
MRLRIIVTNLILISGLAYFATAGDDTADKESRGLSASAQSPADAAETEIRAAAADFEAAFARGDAESLARHWTVDGDYIDEYGQRFAGRAAIQAEYEAFFLQHRGTPMHITVDSVRMIGPDTAIEDGRAVLGSIPAGPPAFSRYTAVHVKQDGQWLMAAVRDTRVEVTPADEHVAD